jgi:hypothetical protein
MMGHQVMLIIDGDASIRDKTLGDTVPGVDARLPDKALRLFLLEWWLPILKRRRSHSVQCREKRRKSGPVVHFRVVPAMHAIVRVHDLE